MTTPIFYRGELGAEAKHNVNKGSKQTIYVCIEHGKCLEVRNLAVCMSECSCQDMYCMRVKGVGIASVKPQVVLDP